MNFETIDQPLHFYEDGVLSARELYVALVWFFDSMAGDAVFEALPPDLREGFLSWVESVYGRGLPGESSVFIAGEGGQDAPKSAHRALHEWFVGHVQQRR